MTIRNFGTARASRSTEGNLVKGPSKSSSKIEIRQLPRRRLHWTEVTIEWHETVSPSNSTKQWVL